MILDLNILRLCCGIGLEGEVEVKYWKDVAEN